MKRIFLFLLGLSVLLSCNFGGKRVKGNGNIRTEERTVSSFRNVEVHGAIDVYLSQGNLIPVRIEGDENLIQYIEIIQEGNKLTVRSNEDYDLRPSKDMKIYLTAPEFREIEVSGACDIIGQTKLSGKEDLRMQVSGSGEIRAEADVPEINAKISGSGEVNLKGETRDFVLHLSGSGTAHCYELLSENTEIDISGSGDAEVYASRKLEARVSGSGTVRYKGEVQNINQKVSGSGSVSRVN